MAPPKFDPTDPAVAALITSFESMGLPKAKATDAARNQKNAAALKEIIDHNDLTTKGLDEKRAGLMATLAQQTSNGKLGEEERSYIVHAIVDGKLKSVDQVSAAVKYLETHPPPITEAGFNQECGVGVVLSAEDIYNGVKEFFGTQTVEGWSALMGFINNAKSTPGLRWAAPLEVKTSAEKVFSDAFGPKELAAKAKKDTKPPKATTSAQSTTSTTTAPPPQRSVFEEGFLGKLHKPGGNPQIHPHLRAQHLSATGGKVFTRFPPEPNGFLHIGHSKAIFVNFGYAAHHGGHCYLRYDDTNPEAEEARYFESILEMVRWLGFEPYKITYSSDHFDRLYELAVELVRRDKAYVCHCTGEEIHANRGGDTRGPRIACSHRSRPIEESLAEFQGMRDGKYKPGEAILRMKQDLEDGNPQMWDMVAYRVLMAPHHRTGDKWIIYPTYDFTHCLCDSFENISHSLCTTEFISSRQSYDWLCDALEVYKPRQSEYGRLNLTGTIMSKRKILKLVKEGHVKDWDDPRLYTLIALRRRGVPPQAIISFVSTLGVSTATTNIQTTRFEETVRQHLDSTVPRLMMVLRPLRVTIENLPEDHVEWIEKPLHPKIPALGTSKIAFTKHIFIDADDFRLEDSPDYFRLAPGKTVGLFQAPHPITCTSFTTDPLTGAVDSLTCTLEVGAEKKKKKPKAFIQWVADHPSTIRVSSTRIFHPLFKSDNPAAQDDLVADLAPDSLEVLTEARVEPGFWDVVRSEFGKAREESERRLEEAKKESGGESVRGEGKEGHGHPVATVEQLVGNEVVRFQGLRVGYFALDKNAKVDGDDDAGKVVVLNRIVSLKEDAGKAA